MATTTSPTLDIETFKTYALHCVQKGYAASIIRMADELNLDNADLAELAGVSTGEVISYFNSHRLDSTAYLDKDQDWTTQSVLSLAGVSKQEAREYILANLGRP